MEKLESRSLLVTILKSVGFILLLCLAVELSKSFVKELQVLKSFRFLTLYFSFIMPFLVSEFVYDLQNPYKNIQNFFFRNSFVSMLLPSLLLISALSYLIIPRLAGGSFNKEIFVFIGGFIFMTHLIFIARHTKGSGFAGVVSYLFMFIMLFIVASLLFGLYFRTAYNFRLGKVVIDSVRSSTSLVQTMFMQIAR